MTCAQCDCALTEDCRFCPRCGSSMEVATIAEGPDGTCAFVQDASAEERTGTAVLKASFPSETLETVSADTDPLLLHRLLTQANLHRIRGQWEAAIDCCVAVLRVEPSSATAHALLGDIYRDRGSLDDAIQWYRLALDLQPNPSDEAKLRFLEAERVRQAAEAGVARRSLSPGSAGSDPTGTALLLGVSPRRWLNGITVASLVFFGFTLGILGLLQLKKTRVRNNQQVSYQPVTSGFSQRQTAIPPPPSASLTVRSSTSSTLFSPGGVPRPIQSAPVPSVPQTAPTQRPSVVGLPPAPVIAVRPTPPASPLPGFDAAGSETKTPTAPLTTSRTLTDGMRQARTWRSTDGSEIALLLTVPAAAVSELGGSLREALLRNLFRASLPMLQSEDSPASVSVYVQSETEANAPDAETLVLARVSRAASNIDPETEPISRLEALSDLRLARRAGGR